MSDKENLHLGGGKPICLLKSMQQKFKRMNVAFGEIRDRMDAQAIVIASLQTTIGELVWG